VSANQVAVAFAAAFCTLVLACGGDDPPPPTDDAGPTDDGGAVDDLVTPPQIPWLEAGVPPVALTPCATGWREVDDESGVTVCRPYPEAGIAACTVGEAHFVGEPTCRPVGDACPSGAFADTLPKGTPVVYVDLAAPPGGDGTLAAPFQSLSSISFSSLRAGDTLALGAGAYEGVLALRAGVSVVGRCARDTTLPGIDVPVTAVVTVTSAGDAARLRNVTIDGPDYFGVNVDAGRAIALEGVVIRGAFGAGIFSLGGTVQATDVRVESTRPDPSFPFSAAIFLAEGAEFDGSRVALTDNSEYGLLAGDPGTVATVTDLTVAGTFSGPRSADAGWGVVAVDGGHADVTRAALVDNEGHGFFVQGTGGSLALRDAVITGTRIARYGEGGWGIAAQLGGVVDAERVFIAQGHGAGIGTTTAGTRVTARHLVVRDIAEISNGKEGRALIAQLGAHLTVENAVVANTREVAAFAGGEGATLSLTDVAIRDTRPRASDGLFGRAVGIQPNAVFDATRLLVEGSHDVGLFASAAATTLTDVVIRDTAPLPDSGDFGFGAVLEGPVPFRLSRVRIEGSFESGILIGQGADVEGTDLAVERVSSSACECERTYGYGLSVYGSRLALDRFSVSIADLCGLLLSAGEFGALPDVDLTNGLVEQTEIGACVQVDGYDLDRISNGVTYRDNGTNLQATMLPVPESPMAIE